MRPVQEVLPHGVRDTADAVEAEPRVRLDVRTVLARARGEGPGPRRTAPHAGRAETEDERAARAGSGTAEEGPRAGREGGERRDQALQDVALSVLWVSVRGLRHAQLLSSRRPVNAIQDHPPPFASRKVCRGQ